MDNRMMAEYIRRVGGQANTLTTQRVYIELTGSIEAALFLGQCIYWSSRTTRPDGYFYKTAAEWYDELGLTRRKLEGARDCLIELGILKTELHRQNNAPTTHYKIDFDALISALERMFDQQEDAENDPRFVQNEQDRFVQNKQMLNIDYTETTNTCSASKNEAPRRSDAEKKGDPIDGMLAYANRQADPVMEFPPDVQETIRRFVSLWKVPVPVRTRSGGDLGAVDSRSQGNQ